MRHGGHTLILAAAMIFTALAGAGCVLVTTPGEPPHAEWAGTYAQGQMAEQDQDRAIALKVSDTLTADPQLSRLHLRIFVEKGEVTLCGRYPDAATQARASAVVGAIDGVTGVDTSCTGH